VEIVDEIWWPEGGAERFTQRVCQVIFDDGSVEMVLAEDLDGECLDEPMIAQNGAYEMVFHAWRQHHAPPPHPLHSNTGNDAVSDESHIGSDVESRPAPTLQISSGDESAYVDEEEDSAGEYSD
jgi:hypothetical protein